MAEGATQAAQTGAVRALPKPAGGGGYDRVPPHNLDAETSVLGAMLLSRDAIAEVSELVGPDDFYRGAHRTLYEAIRDLYDHGEPVDPVTLADELEHRGTLDDVGGAVGITDLVSRVPTAANALYYARIVAEQALRRRLIDAGTGITRLGYDAAKGADEAVDAAEQTIYDVAQRGYSSEFVPMKDLLMESFERIEKLHEAKSSITGLATGFTDFDELTAGLQPQNLVVLAARPAMGKCQSASTLVLDPTTGAYRRLGDIVTGGRAGEDHSVVSLSADLRLGAAPVSAYHDNGVQPVLRLTTRLGREIIATGNHPLLTMDGWSPLSDLRPGWRIATARSLPHFGADPLPSAEVALLAHNLVSTASSTASVPEVPEAVFRLPRGQVALFLNRVFACNGRVDCGADTRVSCTTTSKRLAGDLQHLLLRFGVLATRRPLRRPAADGTGAQAWQLEITGSQSIRTFAAEIGIAGTDDRLREALALLDARAPAHTDTARRPRDVGERIVRAPDDRPARKLSLATGRPRTSHGDGGPRSGSRALVGETVGVPPDGVQPQPATSDVYWDEVVSIERAGHERVYDLTVPGDHTFVANDVVVHNSTLVANIATHVTVEQRKPAVLFSLEMSQRELIDRILAAYSGVASDRLRTGRLADSDWPKLSQAMGRLAEAPLFIDDTPGINMMEIRAKCRRLKAKHGLDLVIVDYLQLMQSHRRAENRVQEVSELSRGMKILAKELDLPVIALSQLSRKPEDRTDRRPQLSDLRESGSIEQDSDLVAFIYRDEVYHPETEAKGEAELIVAKHRNGPLHTVRLSFLGHQSRFANMARRPPPL